MGLRGFMAEFGCLKGEPLGSSLGQNLLPKTQSNSDQTVRVTEMSSDEERTFGWLLIHLKCGLEEIHETLEFDFWWI